MPLKANIGLSKKVGLPDYGSLGASCHIEVELDASLLDSKPAEFQNHVQRIYQACSEAVESQLADQKTNSNGQQTHMLQVSSNGNHSVEQNNGSNRFQASEKQLAYIHQLATQIQGLSPSKLTDLAQQMFHRPLSQLDSLDASALIDSLKEIKAGRLEAPGIAEGGSQ